jgi:hypothetical protein
MYEFKFNGFSYKVVNQYITSDIEGNHRYEIIETNVTREREIFTYIPLFINKKFSWLKKIKIKEQFFVYRREDFDDGWSYQHYWSSWRPRWEKVDIIK